VQNVEAAKKLFDMGGSSYSTKFLDEFVGIDAPTSLGITLQGPSNNSLESAAGNTSKSSVSNFWTRRKK
jgi:hypothetical protein